VHRLESVGWLSSPSSALWHIPLFQEFKKSRDHILTAERIVLNVLCFDLRLDHPISPCVAKFRGDLKRKILSLLPAVVLLEFILLQPSSLKQERCASMS
jgi:hypothetical protein